MKIFSASATLKRALEIGLIFMAGLAAAPCLASTEPVDLFAGFEDRLGAREGDPGTAAAESNPLSGFAKVAAAWNTDHDQPAPGYTDWRGLSKLRGELLLEFTRKIGGWKSFASGKGFYDLAYELNGRADYTDQVLDDYEDEIELRELWLQGELLPSLDLKLGRQIVVWGRSDNFRVTDILNPLDNREPGLADIEDLRMPLVMTRVEYYLDDWRLDLIGVHEHRYDRNPPFGHDFYPYPFPPPADNRPGHSLDNTELALDLTGTFPGWDISFYVAETFDDHATYVAALPPYGEHRRLEIFGTAASVARGSLLYIVEAAHSMGLGFMADPAEEYERTDLLAGLEYSGFTNTLISCDYLYRKLHGYSSLLDLSPERPVARVEQLALRVSRDFFHETLNLTGLLLIFGDQARHGALERLTASWEFADNWSVTGGTVFYESGETPETAFGDNDRVFIEIRRDF